MIGAGRFRRDQPPERSTYLANLVLDVGRQFGDIEHFRENDAQADNLWRASGLEEGPFMQLVYQARQTALRLAGHATGWPIPSPCCATWRSRQR